MFALTRLPGWPRRLADYVEARRRTPFAWGEHDCMSFGIGAIEAITGTIVWPVTWSTAIEAARVLEEAGGPIAAVTSEPVRFTVLQSQQRRGNQHRLWWR